MGWTASSFNPFRHVNYRAQLVPLDGSATIEIARELTLVGRKEDCDLRLDHKSVSKIHCVIVKTDGLLLLRDLGSTNGTRVNGQRIRRAALLPNDKLTIANFHFRVHLGPAEAPPPPPEEHTMHLDVNELGKLLQKQKPADPLGDSSVDAPILQVQTNALPDLYEDDHPKK
jgi:predicted component of type VI protein secretion system